MRLLPYMVAAAIACSALSAIAQSPDRRIEVAAEIDGPVEKVWEAWTTCEGIKTFFARDCNIELRVDGPFAMYFAPDAPAGSRGADNARILALQQHRMLSFSWDAAPPDIPEVRKNRTHVVVRFFALPGNRTRVTLVNDGYGEGEDWDRAFRYLTQAWNGVLASLAKRFAAQPQ
jgi:uncharacterized protein YndB with AHSA1/START domain